MKENPGSKEAIALGCECPVIDNHYGKGVPNMYGDGKMAFWYTDSCPYHKNKHDL